MARTAGDGPSNVTIRAVHLHLVINPTAGRKGTRRMLDGLVQALEAGGDTVTRYETKAAGDAGRHLAALEADAADRILVVGGDGTLREAINGRALELPWPVGVLPLGTANLVGRELGMPLGGSIRRYVEAIRRLEPVTVGALSIEGTSVPARYALACVGVGMDARIVRVIDELRAAQRARTGGATGGYSQWIRPIWHQIRHHEFPNLRVTVDGQRTLRASAVVVQNARNYGGVFRLCPDAGMTSGALTAVLIRSRSRRDLMRILANALLRRVAHDKGVRLIRGEQVRIESPTPEPVQADGDPSGQTDVTIRLEQQAIQLLRVGAPTQAVGTPPTASRIAAS